MMLAASYAARRALKTLGTAFAIIGIAFVLFASAASIPTLEMQIYPPVTSVDLAKYRWLDSRRVEVFVVIEKRRPCRYVEMNWYAVSEIDGKRGKTQLREKLPIKFLDLDDDGRPYSMPVGHNIAGPWMIFMPPEVSSAQMVATRHDCGWSWDSVSELPIDMAGVLAARPRDSP